jgi:hypothetical protein
VAVLDASSERKTFRAKSRGKLDKCLKPLNTKPFYLHHGICDPFKEVGFFVFADKELFREKIYSKIQAA